MRHRLTSVLLVVLLAPALGAVQDITAIVFRDFLDNAARGDVEAQEYVAFAYMYGVGAEQSDDLAIRWYERAAGAGSGKSMSALGAIYEGRKDYARSFEWYSRGAERRDPHSVFRLGMMHQEGWHVRKDVARALHLFEEAAWLDSGPAQHYLGLLYVQGELVPRSYTRGYVWLNIASPKSGEYAKMRDVVEKKLTPEQLAEAQKLSLEWSDKLKSTAK